MTDFKTTLAFQAGILFSDSPGTFHHHLPIPYLLNEGNLPKTDDKLKTNSRIPQQDDHTC